MDEHNRIREVIARIAGIVHKKATHQEHRELSLKKADGILSIEVNGIAIKDLLKLLEEGKLYEKDDDQSLPAYSLPVDWIEMGVTEDMLLSISNYLLQARFKKVKKVGEERK